MRPLQKEIIEELKVLPEIDVQKEIRRSVDFLKNYLLKNQGLSTYVLGISGGQDSTLAGRLAQMAISELREETGEERYQFIAVRLPYGVQADESDAQLALEFIQADQIMTVNIEAATNAMIEAVEVNNIEVNDYHKGNVKARQRMIAQFTIAGQLAGAVIGTDHAAESVTGFFTKFGDGAADILPLWRLNKSQGAEMLKELGAVKELYEKVPTADLEENRPQLADEDALGVSYKAIDAYLRGEDVAEKEAKVIEDWFIRSRHKRHLPITVYDDFWK
ncbi:ammonia-dependent NAD(+) synthetase [Aerococcaceae bacterium INB8]|uniref:NH(3)-dependent NAD(+) synthetase n=1 Tax=Ruoffia halotolerans TaxID=2748684 RepID=A0A839A6B2_9LACT|nr:ammonia-dependent NAD(+) synthetase [Ruoffia halotolerans]MBA5729557.1 ammonia-dependent NAD(+) synthetase [Ruoffia halotolerans]